MELELQHDQLPLFPAFKTAAGDLNEAVFRGVNPLLSQITSSLTKTQLKDSAPVSAHWHCAGRLWELWHSGYINPYRKKWPQVYLSWSCVIVTVLLHC